jgi:hypothetical protein
VNARYANRTPYVPTAKRRQQDLEALEYGPKILAQPQPGFYKLSLVKGGVLVGARITYGPTCDPDTGEALDRSWFFAGEINGKPDTNPRPEPSDAVYMIWERGIRITEDEFNYLIDHRAWAAQHQPHLPEADPRKPVDLRTLDPNILLL